MTPKPLPHDDELLEHYIHRGATAWNVSLEAAWLDYELRAWVRPRIPSRRPLAVCNIGIGVGLWDDWLGHELGVAITSVDRDADICRVFALRQRAEHHPHPARVICGDVLEGCLERQRFDVITLVGSTVAEADHRERLFREVTAALRPEGRALVAEVGQGEPPPDAARVSGTLWIAFAELAPVHPLRAVGGEVVGRESSG